MEHVETVVNTNFYGTKLLTESLLPFFRFSSSRILNVSSRLGLFDVSGIAVIKVKNKNNRSLGPIESSIIGWGTLRETTWVLAPFGSFMFGNGQLRFYLSQTDLSHPAEMKSEPSIIKHERSGWGQHPCYP